MATTIFPLTIQGGFNTESGPRAPFVQSPSGQVVIPWLTAMENGIYSLDGWPMKMPGASKVNSVATGAADHILGIYDYWRQGTTGTAVQKRVIYAGDEIFKDDADGTWDSLLGSLEADKPAAFCVFNDELITSTTSTTDVPQVYDQTSIANLGGTPPDFAFSVAHKQRVFASGNPAVPSRVYYSRLALHEDWTGSGSGSFDVFTDDGDRVTGLRSLNDELVIFKGPHHGSIYRLIGSAPTGPEAFQLIPLIKGVGCTSHQSIIEAGGDLIWWDHHGIHSMAATASFGNYAQRFVSNEIAGYFQDELNHTRLEFVQGVNFVTHGMALWTVSGAGASLNDRIVGIDYRWQPARFFVWPAYAAASIGMVLDGTNGLIPWVGGHTGFVLRTDQTDRNLAGVAYAHRWRSPFIGYSDAFFDTGAVRGHVSFVPKGEAPFTVTYIRDTHAAQDVVITQAAGGQAVLDTFILGTDALASENYFTEFFEMDGSFKALAIELSQGGLDQDVEPHGMSLELEAQGAGAAGTLG